MGIQEYLQEAMGKGASDLFIVAGLPLTYKIPCFYLPSERLSCSSNPSDCIPASKSRGA